MLIVGSADGASIGKLEDLDCFVFLSNRSDDDANEDKVQRRVIILCILGIEVCTF